MKKVVLKKLIAVTTMSLVLSGAFIGNVSVTGTSPVELTSISSIMEVNAATSVRKCYTITTNNTPVYSKSSLASNSKIGSIYPSDEVIVNNVTDKYCNVTYPTTNGKTKTGYIATSNILVATTGNTVTSTGKCTTYKRDSTSSETYGSIFKDDKVIILGISNNMVQVKYPVSGGFKYAFVTLSNAQKYLGYIKPQPYNIPSTPVVYNQNNYSSIPYGYSDEKATKKANLATAGCGILAYVNLIKNINGRDVDPEVIAKYSLANNYRINGVGTAFGLYKSFADSKGSLYGIKYTTYTSKWDDLAKYLQSGSGAIVHNSSHIMCVVKYKDGKYLLLDSAPSSSRGTSNGYRWATQAQLKALKIYDEFYIISPTT